MARNHLWELCRKQLSWCVLLFLCVIWEEGSVIFQCCGESNIHFRNHFCFMFQFYPRANVSKICHPPPHQSHKQARESQFSQKFLLLIQSFFKIYFIVCIKSCTTTLHSPLRHKMQDKIGDVSRVMSLFLGKAPKMKQQSCIRKMKVSVSILL